jgi:hypothetical protein
MRTRTAGRDVSAASPYIAGARRATAVLACLLLAACAGSARNSGWVRAGADEATTAHAAEGCRAQANAALANQRGINQDISATLGGNWQRARTSNIVAQSMGSDAADYAGRVFDGCMRAKGFNKAG